MKLVTVEQMKAIEDEANSRGVHYDQMMVTAGEGLAAVVEERYGESGEKSVMGLIGSGNNGGDALVALAFLAQTGWKTSAYLVRPRQEADPMLLKAQEEGCEIFSLEQDSRMHKLDKLLESSQVWLDGILGTGFQLPLRPDLLKIFKHVEQYEPRGHVVAVDCPSGIDCNLGEVAQNCLKAEITVCMEAVKIGLLRMPAFKYVGELAVVDLELPTHLAAWDEIHREVINADRAKVLLPERPIDAHKGTFGTAMIIAGSANYTGAPYLAGYAAYRSGVGLVRMAVPASLYPILAGQMPEATWLILPHEMGVISTDARKIILRSLDRITAILIGPGLGTEETTREFFRQLLTSRAIQPARGSLGFQTTQGEKEETGEMVRFPPFVVDADGLRLLAKVENWPTAVQEQMVLTPHPGEMAVLTNLTVEEIQANRLVIAEKYAQKWGHVVVLKGAVTIVAAPDGRSAVIPVATPALAHAGTGDVLAGVIVGLRAQGLSAYDAALAGAWIHARAGLLALDWIGHSASVLAGDVLEAISDVFSELNKE